MNTSGAAADWQRPRHFKDGVLYGGIDAPLLKL